MPRQARIDIPGLLQHVIVRGIERCEIFRDDTDRKDFLRRLSLLLKDTDTDCFAWALIPNHFHLLLRPNRCDLKQFMRRLLTGYALSFNRRHRRSGHLFQNRYKSIACEEDSYLLELIRYIHLNPLRAGMVEDPQVLEHYPWCGHSVLMGRDSLAGQRVDEVLALFSGNLQQARIQYSNFVLDGIALGNRPELVGRGTMKSLTNSVDQDNDTLDPRILGSESFVHRLRQEEGLRDKLAVCISLDDLRRRVEESFELPVGRLNRKNRDSSLQAARDVFCHIAVRTLGYSGTETGKMLGIKRSAVSHALKRGSAVLERDPELTSKILAERLNN